MAWKPKYPPNRSKRRRRSFDSLLAFAVVLTIVVLALGLDRVVRYVTEGPSRASVSASAQRLPTIITQPNDSNFVTVRAGGTNVIVQHGGSNDITIVDGDTVRSGGTIYRLVGFDTPERGDRALCDRERDLAEKASNRLRALVISGAPSLERTACACKTGTEGTRSCNFGRSCAYLKISGRDVGEILIREGLAQPFVCGQTSCPPRKRWC